MEQLRFVLARQKKTILFILGLIVIAILFAIGVQFALSQTPENIKKGEIKEKVSEEIKRQDFNVDRVVVESQDWTLGRIESTNENDAGNPAFVILHKENDQMVLKFGPGTMFVKADLDAAGVPQAVQEAIFGGQSKYIKDPIIQYLPRNTDFYSVRYTPSVDEEPDQKKRLSIVIYEVPRLGIYATPQKRAEYKAEVEEWIRSLGLDPSSYTIITTT